MAEQRKTDWLIPLFFLFGLVAILPPVVLFTLFKPAGALVVSSGWILLTAFAITMFVWSRNRVVIGTPAASIVAASLGFKLQNDRVLAGEIEGIPLKAIWSPSGTRIDAQFSFRKGKRPTLDAWFSSLTAEQRVAMFEAVGNGDLEVAGGELQLRTRLSFRVPEHGESLVFHLRDAARIARALDGAGAPPDGCVAWVRDERQKAGEKSAGTLTLAQPDSAQGAVSMAALAGSVSLPKKS